MLVVVIVAVVYAIYLVMGTQVRATPDSVAELERALASAKQACVAGPPQGPACQDMARITTELAERRRRP